MYPILESYHWPRRIISSFCTIFIFVQNDEFFLFFNNWPVRIIILGKLYKNKNLCNLPIDFWTDLCYNFRPPEGASRV